MLLARSLGIQLLPMEAEGDEEKTDGPSDT